MNVIFTCGGTGGHINPAIAVAKILKERRPQCRILFVGAEDGMESTLVPREGFELELLRVSNYQRKLTPEAIWHNMKTAVHIVGSLKRADQIIADFQPDVIVGTGGYASFPMLREGAKKGIPICVHESNAVPGLATRMVADVADRILVCFEESRKAYRHPERVVVVGMPVRPEFIYTKREEARRELGLGEKPLVISAWGSLGAREMNKKIAAFMALEAETAPFTHIHATGSFGWRWMPEYVKSLGLDLTKYPQIDMREYIYNMPQLMAAADLIIGRAGSSTLNEIAASGTPCIIVPSPNVTDNHQEKNAAILEKRGAAVVIHEQDCTPEKLYETVTSLLADPKRLAEMRKNLFNLAVFDSAERIYQTILELSKTKK